MMKVVKLVALIVAAVAGGWWARLAAHSKRPPAEGVWREISDAELS
jgi:hypothetical protein